jgi:hypothetical protein
MQCEHETIHLTWDLVTIYLNPTEFEQVAELLEHGSRLATPATLRQPHNQLILREKGYYQLWLRNVALNLSPTNFLILVDLVRVALKNLDRDRPVALPGRVEELPKPLHHTVEASPNNSFSLN